MNIKDIEDMYGTGIYPMKSLEIVRGKGAKVWDNKGKEYIDYGLNYGVSNVGHCNEFVVSAIKEQLEKIIYLQSTFYNQNRAMLLKKLSEITGLDKSFLCSSGAEAVEAAIKFARAHTGKKEIISTKGGFHGRTMGALSATWKKKYKEPFLPLVPGFCHVRYNDANEIKEKINENTAAVILEPIQGENGVIIPDKNYLKEVRKICDDSNVLLILDEIQTGFCRTGKMFAFQHFDVKPDILCLAKSLGGGFPIGAMVAKKEVCDLPVLSHATTFGGNPPACTAALASIRYMEEKNLDERSAELGDYFLKKLGEINSKKIRDVRGLGLMIGVELRERAGKYLSSLLEEGIIALPSGSTVIRLLPPLVIEKEDIDIAIEKFKKVLG